MFIIFYQRIVIVLVLLFFSVTCFADDSSSYISKLKDTRQGEHKFSLDVIYYHEYEKSYLLDDLVSRTNTIENVFTSSIDSKTDFSIDVPFKYITYSEGSLTGFDDIGFYLTRTIYENNGWALYISPEIYIPNGNYQYGIGNGKVDYGVFISGSKKIGRLTNYFSAEFFRNENKVGSNVNIWKLGVYPEYKINDKVSVFVGARVQQDTSVLNPHKPFFASCGLGYIVNKYLIVTPSFEQGFSEPERDLTYYLTFSFSL